MENLIYKKMSQVMSEIGAVGKDQENTMQKFKFRGIDQFLNATHPALVKHGVFMIPRCISITTEIKDVVRSSGKPGVDKHVTVQVEYDFVAEDGSKVTIGPVPGEGLDSGDKATSKAMTAAEKCALIQTFCIPTQDMSEGDKDSPEISMSSSKKQLVDELMSYFENKSESKKAELYSQIIKLTEEKIKENIKVQESKIYRNDVSAKSPGGS